MSAEIDLACEVCGAEFGVTVDRYEACSGVVECPTCGSTDLVLLVFGRLTGRRRDGTAA